MYERNLIREKFDRRVSGVKDLDKIYNNHKDKNYTRHHVADKNIIYNNSTYGSLHFYQNSLFRHNNLSQRATHSTPDVQGKYLWTAPSLIK